MENITWLGHASFSFLDLESENRIYYVDPFHLPQDTEMGSIDKADIIFVTHAHQDHLSPPDISRLLKEDTVVVATEDSLETLLISQEKFPVTPNNEYEVKGFKFKTVPAYNLNPQRPHKREYGWVGYIFTINGVKIYHAGDTDFIPEMEGLAKENLDIAMIPIGGTYVMTPEEAVKAANAIKAKKTIPMHYKGLLKEKTEEGEEILKKGVTESTVVIMEEFK
jgi:L-ascorbate metabolism protein UlaG (beta-lactamase superfamily)